MSDPIAGPSHSSVDPEVAAELQRRQRNADARGVVREKTGARLSEAKQRIDAFEAQMAAAGDDLSARTTQIVVWLLVIAAGVAVYLIASWMSRG